MSDFRVSVQVEFTLDIGALEHVGGEFERFRASQKAVEIARDVFKESFSRAHIIRISSGTVLELTK